MRLLSLWARGRALVAAVAVLALLPAVPVAADPLDDFTDTVVIAGLTNPTAIKFAPDGRVFVAEKSGLIKVFDDLSDTTPQTFADLRTNVHNYWDRGLLGLALDPNWGTNPAVYALYAHDAAIGGTAPRWGTPGATSDTCPTPPGPTTDGCVVSGRLSRMTVLPGNTSGAEQVLIEDWCQQFPSHSVGSLAFGADGALYVSAGDGAGFIGTDYGQSGNPKNPCGDPPAGVGGNQTPPTSEGGALRAQDLRTTADPMTLDGTILRVDPLTGAALPTNPMFGSSDANTRRVIATGLRNPFRMTIRPGTNEIWMGDVGLSGYEEIDRIPSPTDANVENFGWPCYEGPGRQSSYDALNLNLCETLYSSAGAETQPIYSYSHGEQVVPGEPCPSGTSSAAGIAFYEGGDYPASYDGALFFADYSRDCIWVMYEQGGQPDPSTRATFISAASDPVDLEIGPGGDLFYVDFSGSIHRVEYATGTPPETKYLSDLSPETATNGHGPYERDRSNGEDGSGDGSTITLNGTTYTKGLGIHAASEITYDLSSMDCTRLKSDVGVDDEVGASGSIVFEVYSGATEIYDSGVMGGTTATKSVDLDITGVTSLVLKVTDGGDGITYDHGDWGSARIDCGAEPPPPDSTYLSDLTPDFATNGYGPYEEDQSNGEDASGDGGAITLNGSSYDKGLGIHAASELTYDLAGMSCTKFKSDVGVDDEVGPSGSIVFQVYAGATKIYDSGTMSGSTATKSVNVDITGVSSLGLKVTDGGDGIAYDHGDWAKARVECGGGTGSPPTATITTPASSLQWKVGDTINFSGSATDPEDGPLPASALSWEVIMHHCPAGCHEHSIQSFDGVSSGSFVAPDHEYPSHLELELTATDSSGKTDVKSVELQPQTVALTFVTSPAGGQISVGGSSSTAPFTRTVIVGSTNSVNVPSPQTIGGTSNVFSSWSDGGARAHDIVAPASPTTYTATLTSAAGPVITNVQVSNITRNRATITWTTDVPATTQIEYGLTTSYGSLTTLNSGLETFHSQTLRGLTRNRTYHFRVLSKNGSGTLSTSGDFTFRTLP
jgi:glucose/arabinose dehydrogenase